MGFLSGLSGILGGGSQQESSGSTQSGFGMLPSSIQQAYSNFGNAVNSQIPNAQMAYTPMPQTADETAAFNAIRQGFAPTQASLGQDVSMLMNPFNDSVINGINREAQGQNSILKQTLDQAGQFGSNRQVLGANDIENSRQGMIGSLLQNQYNQAIGQIFNNLIPQRQQDAQGLLGIGNFQRGLAQQTASAPITGLQQLGTALSVLPQSGGSVQNQSSNQFQSNNGTFGNLLSTAGGLASIFSDKRLKEDIKNVGRENGHNIYEFSYKGHPARFIGVMAQEVERSHPHAITMINGYRAVNYNAIGVKFREVAC